MIHFINQNLEIGAVFEENKRNLNFERMTINPSNRTFWTTGNGKDFLKWANISEQDIPQNFNSQMFYHYDAEIDELVKKWLQNGDFKKIMQSLHGSLSHIELPEDYISLKNRLSNVPDWVDFDLLREAGELSQRSGLTGLLVLRNFALLGGYYFANLTKPLVATGSLEKGAVHRLYNTLSFWVDVSRTSANAQELRINACLRTRLVHSASRLMIEQKYAHWDQEKYGIPINHADMIATNIAFTVYYLYGLQKLNFDFTEKEEKGIFHLWKYVTWMLGVPEEAIPQNKTEALHFFYFWTQYQFSPDEDSKKLTDSLLHENTSINLLKLDVVKRNMGYIHKSIANYLLDDHLKSSLKIPTVPLEKIIPNALRLKNEITLNREKQIETGNAEQQSVLEDYKNNISTH